MTPTTEELERPCCMGCFALLDFSHVDVSTPLPGPVHAERWLCYPDGEAMWCYACACGYEAAGSGPLPSVARRLRMAGRMAGRMD